MNCKKRPLCPVKSTLSILLILTASLSLSLVEHGFSQQTSIYLHPFSSNVAIGRNFSVDINISSVIDLYGWEFKLRWDPFLLDIVDVVEGPFLKLGGLTFFCKKLDSAIGYVLVDCTILGAVTGVSGSGTIATIQFCAENTGVSILDLYDTILVNSVEAPIPHIASDGSVQILSNFHNVAITAVLPSRTVVGQGLTMRVWVTAENQGTYTETFSVTVYYDTTNQIGTESITLASGGSTTITFTWNTLNIAKGGYVSSAVASSVPEETDNADNVYVDGTISVAMVGDITGVVSGVPDGKVDIRDLATMARAYGSYPSHPDWNPNADINDDDKVDIKDLATAAKNYGKIDP